MNVWIVTGKTESSDEVSAVFKTKPSIDQVDGYFYKTGWADEYKYVGFISWSLNKIKLVDPNTVTQKSIDAMKKAKSRAENE